MAGSSEQASKSASVKTTANKALKKAKKANRRLNALDLKTIFYAVVGSDGALARGSTGTSSSKVGTGLYQANFPQDISQCAWVTSIGGAERGCHPVGCYLVQPRVRVSVGGLTGTSSGSLRPGINASATGVSGRFSTRLP